MGSRLGASSPSGDVFKAQVLRPSEPRTLGWSCSPYSNIASEQNQQSLRPGFKSQPCRLPACDLRASYVICLGLQAHLKCAPVSIYSELETRALGNSEFWYIHMYDLINAEAEIPCTEKALSQRWFLNIAGIHFLRPLS